MSISHEYSIHRTLLVFKIMNIFLDLDAAMSCQPMDGFALVPLPSTTTLWQAATADKWGHEFESTYQERTIYGVSTAGELIRLRQRLNGIDSAVTEWDEWNAGMGEMGTLITSTASLFRASSYLL